MAEADLAIPMRLLVIGIASFASLARVKMAGTSPAMAGLVVGGGWSWGFRVIPS
jgi:hypothetical protein